MYQLRAENFIKTMNECRLCLKTGGRTPVGINFPGFYHIEGSNNEFFGILQDIFGVKVTNFTLFTIDIT